MDAALLILQLLTIVGMSIIGFILRNYLTSYSREKGKNLATKEDIVEITNKVEEVRSQYSSDIERLKIDLGLLARKHDILLDEKIRVFKELQKRLVAYKRYCEAALGEFSPSEFHPWLDSLPDEIDKSTLMHQTALHYLEQDNYIFLTDRARKALASLHDKMSIMCSLELAVAGSEVCAEITASVPGAYMSAMNRTDKCLVELYKDLQMPE